MSFYDPTASRSGHNGAVRHPPEGADEHAPIREADAPRAEVLYVTDPICSHCWALEPAWRKLLYHYGDRLAVRHVYGGLLPGWEGFSDLRAGVSQPSDVAVHWDEVAQHYGQPIDPGVWLRDPLPSSYPPSIAVHAVRMLAPEREEAYLRRIRDALFLEARNIARADVLTELASEVGIDAEEFSRLYGSGVAEAAFRRDLDEKHLLGVRGFPTLIVRGRVKLRGTQPYERLERGLLKATGWEPSGRTPTPAEALAAYGSGTTREFAELLGLGHDETVRALEENGGVRRPIAGDALWSGPAGQPVR